MVSSGIDRQALQAEFIAFAEPLWAKADEKKLFSKDDKTGKRMYMDNVDGVQTSQTFMDAEGVMVEDWKNFAKDWFNNIKPILPSAVVPSRLEDDQGHVVVH